MLQGRRDRGWVVRIEHDAVLDVPRRGDRRSALRSEPFDHRTPDQPGATHHERNATAQSKIHATKLVQLRLGAVRLATVMTVRPIRVRAAQVRKMPRCPSAEREPIAMIGPETIAPTRRVFV